MRSAEYQTDSQAWINTDLAQLLGTDLPISVSVKKSKSFLEALQVSGSQLGLHLWAVLAVHDSSYVCHAWPGGSAGLIRDQRLREAGRCKQYWETLCWPMRSQDSHNQGSDFSQSGDRYGNLGDHISYVRYTCYWGWDVWWMHSIKNIIRKGATETSHKRDGVKAALIIVNMAFWMLYFLHHFLPFRYLNC